MSNTISNWFRSRKLKIALAQSNLRDAEQLLQEIQKSGAKLSWLEKLFRDKLQSEQSRYELERETVAIRRQLTEVRQNLEAEFSRQKLELEQTWGKRSQSLEAEFSRQRLELEKSLSQQQKLFASTTNFLLTPNSDYVNLLTQKFQMQDIDEHLIHCTGLDIDTFETLELKLVEYLKSELERYKRKVDFFDELQAAVDDIYKSLKKGKDPDYQYSLTPHVYFIRYFLEGVYSAYLAWYLVYKSGLLQANINVLDIGAGSGAMLYGLSSFLQSVDSFSPLSQAHISYCSFEQQDLLQFHGLKFWRIYARQQQTPAVNSYLRFYTNNIFNYGDNTIPEKLPKKFFDFIVISHCIFANSDERYESHQIYKEIFSESLKNEGYALIVVQGSRLFQSYGYRITDDKNQENNLIEQFLQELGLKLVWYRYLTSTGQRTPFGSEFAKYAREKLPPQKYITELAKEYKVCNYDLHYTLDDYVVLAQK